MGDIGLGASLGSNVLAIPLVRYRRLRRHALTVRATANIVSAIGISKIVGGMFITAPMAALPELFAVWSVTRSGQVTAATTGVMGDHAVTMTVAFLPLALIGLPVSNFQLLWVNLSSSP